MSYGFFTLHGTGIGTGNGTSNTVAMGHNMLYRSVYTGLYTGKEPGPIVSHCAGPVTCYVVISVVSRLLESDVHVDNRFSVLFACPCVY